MPVRVQFTLALLLVAFGGAVLAMPAGFEGPALVQLGARHAVSLVDLVGAVPLALGGTWLEILIVLRLPRLRLGPRTLLGLGFAAGLGLGLVLASVYQGYWWWAIGAGAFAVVLAGLTVRALTTTDEPALPATPTPPDAPETSGPRPAEPPSSGRQSGRPRPAAPPSMESPTADLPAGAPLGPKHLVPATGTPDGRVDPAPAAPGAGPVPAAEPARTGRRSRKKESPDEFTLGLGD
ncbi:hypothetical protein Lfu02_45100 [Longispora fulva]|uniref:Uncharacterized protein n=1 Tax=Longispora fulva TaxID=619741 RepID=A0A8J7KKB8_9ACTN|nr:hypothetical protein [Longispora fulva]MBG6137884.1 hypothetical protein [Longispora fulva]GIG60138.1 hypothetical protein Lfu02_45100 [Longispora fulva]